MLTTENEARNVLIYDGYLLETVLKIDYLEKVYVYYHGLELQKKYRESVFRKNYLDDYKTDQK